MQPGQILGLAGLLGSGRTETARLLFGADRADSGTIYRGQVARYACVRHTMRSRSASAIARRIARRRALSPNCRFARTSCWRCRRSAAGGARSAGNARANWRTLWIERLGIKAPDAEQPIGLLSGGNQQKALLARWLATEPKLLILDEPTRGIDVAAKFDIMDRMLALCANGLAILFISSEVSEVLRVSHRVAVLRDRRKIAEVAGNASNEDNIYRLIAGSGE